MSLRRCFFDTSAVASRLSGASLTQRGRLPRAPIPRCIHSSPPRRSIGTASGKTRHTHHSSRLFGYTLATIGVFASLLSTTRVAYAEKPPDLDLGQESPKVFRFAEVQRHGIGAERIWAIRGDRVYDITDWIPSHPGGEVILRAAGGLIDPYWKIFSIHHKQDVYDILEQYFIGVVDPRDLVDGLVPADRVEDPFKTDPERDPRLKPHSDRPCNSETPASELETFITPNNVFYVRNHLWVPPDDGDSHKITVELYDGTTKDYTLGELRQKFQSHTVTATLQCSGNRRRHMTLGARSTNGLQWDVGAIGTAEWTGVRLRDVLKDAGLNIEDLPDDTKHAQFVGEEAYGASIPIEKAIDKRGDVLLAYEMNGAPLPRDHGAPVRVIVPGHVAARSVKWVNKIIMSDEESTSQWQRRDYKCFGPNEGAKPDWERARSIQEMPVQSAITSVKEISSHAPEARSLIRVYGLEEDSIALQGYAFSGGGREIIRVDVSADNGHTWHQAELLESKSEGNKSWAWKQWSLVMPKRLVGRWFIVKAVDEAYNCQPDSYDPTYNFRGNLTTAWHRYPYEPKMK